MNTFKRKIKKLILEHEAAVREIIFALIAVIILLAFMAVTCLAGGLYDDAGKCACGMFVAFVLLRLIDSAKDEARKSNEL